jgi:hypothetical protein
MFGTGTRSLYESQYLVGIESRNVFGSNIVHYTEGESRSFHCVGAGSGGVGSSMNKWEKVSLTGEKDHFQAIKH